MLQRIVFKIRAGGISGILSAIKRRINPPIAKNSMIFCKRNISGKSGIEIGGITALFKKNGILPIYPMVGSLDNCNFSSTTTWEGEISGGFTFEYKKNHTKGMQYISDATDLSQILSLNYDFVISSHVIEHVANPIKALIEWKRIIKDNGYLILILPHKDGTFDHKRPVTKLDHLNQDYKNLTDESDLSHLNEILDLHDLKKDIGAGPFDKFKERSLDNYSNRCLHHHVFDTKLVIELLTQLNFKIHNLEHILPYHIITIAQKLGEHEIACNKEFMLKPLYQKLSPFKSDKT